MEIFGGMDTSNGKKIVSSVCAMENVEVEGLTNAIEKMKWIVVVDFYAMEFRQ